MPRKIRRDASGELEQQYYSQLPTVAALLLVEQEDPDDLETAARKAVDLVDAILDELEGR